MDMQHGHAAWTCRFTFQCHAARTCGMDMQDGHVTRTCRMDIQHGNTACACSMDMQHRHEARTCSIDVPDRRSRILEVVLVRRLVTWVLGIWRGGGGEWERVEKGEVSLQAT